MLISIGRQLLRILIDCSRRVVGHLIRKFGAAYRRTQYIYAPDAAAAIAHLVSRGLSAERPRQKVEAFNICDQESGTYRDLLGAAYEATGDPR